MASERTTVWNVDRLVVDDCSSLVPRMAAATFEAFKADVAERGVVSPLDVTAKRVVLDGVERLRAARDLGIDRVPVRVVAPVDELEYRVACAVHRRDLTASQRAMLVVELSAIERRLAEGKRRRRANLVRVGDVAALPHRGRTRTDAALQAGVSERFVQDAITVLRADPNLAARVKAGAISVEVAARKVRRRERDNALPPPPPLPGEPFDLIYADPPWQLGNPDSKHAPEQHYPTMPLAEIKALNAPASDNAFLALWAVTSLLPEALEVVTAWGLDYKSTLIWEKPAIKLGVYARNRHETLLLATRGKFPVPDPEDRPDSVIAARCGRHSEKPDVFYELLERMYPRATKLELFARKPRAGWTSWGNEVAPT